MFQKRDQEEAPSALLRGADAVFAVRIPAKWTFAFVRGGVLSRRVVFLKGWQGNRHHWVGKSEETRKCLGHIGSLSFFKVNII